MILNFDTEDAVKKSEVSRGVYQFRVTDLEQREFASGTEGFTAKFDVFLPDRVIQVWENMYYTPKALWKIEELCKALGLKYRTGMDSKEFIGKSGRAFFGRKKNEKYLSLMEFITSDGSSPIEEPPPSVTDKDVPF